MERWKPVLQRLEEQFWISPEMMQAVAQKFQNAIRAGLTGQRSSLKMLPSYLARPTGQEQGLFLALDFGGTNVRVSQVELGGRGRIRVLRRVAKAIKGPKGDYDYTREQVTAEELFDFLASLIAEAIDGYTGEAIRLGHTFSFPSRQKDIGHAELIHWAKEFRTSGVEGQDVGKLLTEALARRGLGGRVEPVAIINDTVGTLLTAAYGDKDADIGSILGTGHNTCYMETNPISGLGPMIINMESGNFDRLPFTAYDEALDSYSHKPGEQRLEKMVSGHYVGELVRRMILDLMEKEGWLSFQEQGIFARAFAIRAEDLSLWLSDRSSNLEEIERWLHFRAAVRPSKFGERYTLRSLAEMVVRRSARLVAATYLAVLNHRDPEGKSSHTIAVDGSLYEKMPGYGEALQEALAEAQGSHPVEVKMRLTKAGSEVGAAIAAAVVSSRRRLL
ncbi:hexokinase [Heliobacterium chlorum]|uniref:Hexokinase n=1 Tax=Heliobacterium chlorum TaxID=2698 RepID=A0ABR7T2F0_HELCL|nr:hexokinase [Heliobacterium chlorum]MBC9784150.1 hexokinase [Heliobacterium chlorum]